MRGLESTPSVGRLLLLLGLGLLAALPVACDDDDNGDGGGGIGGAETTPAVVTGPITGFGSIFVNGIEFDVAGAEIMVDHEEATETALELGQIVTIEGVIDEDTATGTATRVVADDDVEGPIDAIDLDEGALVVLGQPVFIDEFTVVAATTLDALMPGDVVSVSGFGDAGEAIRATRIERLRGDFTPGDETIEVTGPVRDLDLEEETFRVRDLLVDFTGAELVDLGEGLSNGVLVEVESTAGVVAGRLRASRVRGEEEREFGEAGDIVLAEGFISRVIGPELFEAANWVVRADDETFFEHGDAGNLATDARVGVTGVLGDDGVVLADSIDFRPPADVVLEGILTAVDPIAGEAELLGVPLVIDDATIVDEIGDEGDEFLPVGDIEAGNRVLVVGFRSDAGEIVATRFRRDPGTPVENSRVFGPVTAVARPNFQVAGVEVRTTATTERRGPTGDLLSENTFFTALGPGDVVEVVGIFADGLLLAGEAVLVED